MPKRLAALALTLAALCGCRPAGSEAPQAEPAPQLSEAPLGVEFRLPVGQSVRLPADGMALEFIDVSEDSRCPVGRRCIWPGQVSILLRATGGEGETTEAKLTYRVGESSDSAAVFGPFSVRLIGVEPYPEQDAPIERSSYAALLIVEPSGERDAPAGQG